MSRRYKPTLKLELFADNDEQIKKLLSQLGTLREDFHVELTMHESQFSK